jgi:hypothetical protein
VRLLLELDNKYNALQPDAPFRTFVYNVCAPGRGGEVIANERTAARNSGGGCTEGEWREAQRMNPDPVNMYPCPIHFLQGLDERVTKQVSMFEVFHTHLTRVEALKQQLEDLHQSNGDELKKLQDTQVLLEFRWLEVCVKLETQKRLGRPLGREQDLLLETATRLLQELRAPGKGTQASNDLEGLVVRKSAAAADRLAQRSNAADGTGGYGGLPPLSGELGGGVDERTLQDWGAFLQNMQLGLERLSRVVDRDVRDIYAAKVHHQRSHR